MVVASRVYSVELLVRTQTSAQRILKKFHERLAFSLAHHDTKQYIQDDCQFRFGAWQQSSTDPNEIFS